MAQLVYIDNNILRPLIDSPNNWDGFCDSFFRIFGQDIRPIESYYLFFEYVGFTKSLLVNSGTVFCKFDNIINSLSGANKRIDKISLILEQSFDDLYSDLYKQIFPQEIQKKLGFLINKRLEFESKFDVSVDLKNILFGNILALFQRDYSKFSQITAYYLAWDCFCSIFGKNISTKILRNAQLGIWIQLWEKKIYLPFGKIIDDLADDHQKSKFEGEADMVDAEAQTYLIMGMLNEAVNFLTLDPCNSVQARMGLLVKVFKEYELERKIKVCPGKVYRLNEDMTIELQIPIAL